MPRSPSGSGGPAFEGRSGESSSPPLARTRGALLLRRPLLPLKAPALSLGPALATPAPLIDEGVEVEEDACVCARAAAFRATGGRVVAAVAVAVLRVVAAVTEARVMAVGVGVGLGCE
mmetsp:Transcript_7812/g.16075  ORF Transcript_7812/g.16075 Transcript_7812/m.16075 type:complete len:118 (-) Transcript_7812:33-386(-)